MWVNPFEILGNGFDDDGNGYTDDIHGINALTLTGDPMDDQGHGTHVAGTIGATGNNGIGVAGVNWNVKMVGAKSFNAAGSGYDSDHITCLDYLINLKSSFGQNIVAINASWGGASYNQPLKDAIDAVGALDIVFCAAAGNDGTDNDASPHYPSSYTSTNIMAVTSVDHDGIQHHNYGATSVDLGAPGVDILSTTRGIYTPAAGDLFFDNMESGSSNWTTGGTNNTWAITTNQESFANPSFPVPSPPNFWSDSPGANYVSNTDSWLRTGPINLSAYVGTNTYLGFGSAMYIEDYYDNAYVEVSGNGTTWTSLMDFSGYAYYWLNPYSYLTPDAVKTSTFYIRFHLVSDSSVQYWGWLIDDIGIGATLTYGYGYKNGTSMATPHVTGAVALIATYNPSDTMAQRIARILNNVVALPSLSGMCTTGGMLNLYNTVTSVLPSPPINPTPVNGATDVPVNATLDWDDCIATTQYEVYFGTTSPPSLVDTVTSSSYDPGTLNYNQAYYWKIIAKNISGEASGPIWDFTTAPAPTGAKIAYLKGSSPDFQVRVYTAPTSVGERGTLIGTDYWTCDGNTVAVTNIDVNGDGVDEIAYLKGSGTDFQIRIYTAPTSVGEKGTLVGTDYWTCDGPTVAITNVDVNGDGTDEIAYLKGNGTDFQVRVYTAPTSVGDRGTLIGTDYWTCDGNTKDFTGAK